MAAAAPVATGSFYADSPQADIPIAMTGGTKAPAGAYLEATICGSLSAGSLSAPDGTWAVLDAQITTTNGMVVARWWKIAGTNEPTTYHFSCGSAGGTTDYVSGVLTAWAVAGATPIDTHLHTSGTLSAGQLASTPSADAPTIADVVIGTIAMQSGGDSNGFGGSPSSGWGTLVAEPRSNALVTAWNLNEASSTSTPYAFAVSPGLSAGDFASFLTFLKPGASGSGSGSSATFSPGDVQRNDAGVIVKQGSVQLLATAPSGGTAPYTYQWYRAQTAPFVPGSGNALAGQTAIALNDQTVVAGQRYYYVLGMADSSTPANVAYTQPVMVAIPTSIAYVGFIGDGHAYGVGTAVQSAAQACLNAMGATLTTVAAPKQVAGINASVAGTSSRDWLPGGSYLGPAIQRFIAAGVQDIIVSLGSEDARDDNQTAPADFISYLRDIAEHCTSEIKGVAVYFMFPPPIDPARASGNFSVNSLGRLISYLSVFSQVPTGIAGSVQGDTNAWSYFTQTLFDQIGSDGVHTNDIGAASLGALWARAVTGAPVSTAAGPSPAALLSLSWPTV